MSVLSDDFTYGDFIGASDLDDALLGIIDFWSVSYLREVARRAGEAVDEFKPFRSKRVAHELAWMSEDQTPGLILVNAGTHDTPLKQGTSRPGQTYYATWEYQIGVLTSARGKKDRAIPRAQRLAKMYALAMRLLIIHKRDDPGVNPDWKGIMGMTDWVGEAYDGIDSEGDRTICLAHTDFYVNAPAAATWATGPLEPDVIAAPEPERWPEVAETEAAVTKEPT